LRKENAWANAVAGGRLESTRYPTQQRLIAAIRRGEESAIHELFVLYAPLLRDQAKKMSVPAGECDQMVDTLLDDVAVHLVEVEIPPQELTTYIVSSLRNRIRSGHRDAGRAAANTERACAAYGDSAEKIVAECHSEYGLRASLPSDADADPPLRSAVLKLAHKSAGALSEEDLILMIGVGRHIPLRDIAEQLGITHGHARVKVSRLRERFIRLAIQYLDTLEPAEKREVERFFRRADVRLDREANRSSTTDRSNADRQQPPPEEQS